MSFSSALRHTRRRVVVTGMGGITPLGNTLVDSWNAILLNEKSGETTLEEALQWQGLPEDQHERELKISKSLPCQVAAPVKSKNILHNPRTPRFVQFALTAAGEAMEQSGLLSWISGSDHDEEEYNTRKDRIGVCVGSGMSGVREITEAARTIDQSGVRRLSPHFVPKVLSNSAAGRISLQYQLRGPNHSASTACAAGSHAIGDAMRCIEYGNADVVLAGGAEACIDPLSIAGFCRLRALSTKFPPSRSSRPFDKARDGFVMAEGAAILVLEEMEHAKNRGAPILAELCGYGLTGDAHHITSPDPNGSGAERAMQMALHQANHLRCDDNDDNNPLLVGYINAHATSTPKGDEIEARTIDQVLSLNTNQHPLYVSSTKGATGHLLGAAGAIEAAFTVLSLVHQSIPPTFNLEEVDHDDFNFKHVIDGPIVSKTTQLEAAINNSFGFGGTNASLVFRRYKQ